MATIQNLYILVFVIFYVSFLNASEQTVIFQNGREIHGPSYNDVRDCSIGTRVSHTGNLSFESYFSQQRALFYFSLYAVPYNAKIKSARLSFYIESYPGQSDNKSVSFAIYRLLRDDWDHTMASWVEYAPDKKWETVGGDFEKEPLDKATVSGSGAIKDTWVEFNVTSAVQKVVMKEKHPCVSFIVCGTSTISPVLGGVGVIQCEAPIYISRGVEYPTRVTPETIAKYSKLRPKLEITFISSSPAAIANAGNPIIGTFPGSKVSLNGSKSISPKGLSKDLIYKWSFLKKPKESKLTDANILPNQVSGRQGGDHPSFTVDIEGDYLIELTVSLADSNLVDFDIVNISAIKMRTKHPRIWLTPEILKEIKANPKWDTFKTTIDKGHRDGKLYGNALVWLVTGDKSYGEKAVKALKEIAKFNLVEGTPGYLGSYHARYHGVDLAVGYDWLYDLLTEQERKELWQTMNSWASFYFYVDSYSAGWSRYCPENNFFYGRIPAGGLTGIATYGDNPRAKEWLDLVRYNYYERIIKPCLIKYHPGGGWPEEGSDYGTISWPCLFDYFAGLRSATGEDLFRDTSMSEMAIYHVIYCSQPSMDRYLATGDWTGSQAQGHYGENTPGEMMLNLLEVFRGSFSGEFAQWFVNRTNSGRGGYYRWNWRSLFLVDEKAPERDIKSLPLSYLERGQGFVYARSDWNKEAVWLGFHCGGGDKVDHEHCDQGSLFIWKNDWLLPTACTSVDAYTGGSSTYYSTIGVSDGKMLYGQGLKAPEGITAFEDRGIYLYTSAKMKDAYSDMENFTRELIYLRPNVVIIRDFVKVGKEGCYPVWLAQSVTEPKLPKLNEKMSTVVNGKGKLDITTFLPANAEISKVKWGKKDRAWRLEVLPKDKKRDATFLHVLVISDSDEVNKYPVKCELKEGKKLMLNYNSNNAEIEFEDNIGGGNILIKKGNKVLIKQKLTNKIEWTEENFKSFVNKK